MTGAGYVLVVDDHPINVKLVVSILGLANLPTRVARDRDEVWARCTEETPRLVLMDVQLPGTDGLTITRQLRADPRFTAVPIVALTAYAMTSDEKAAREAGCDDFMSKPIDVTKLLSLVKRMVGEAEVRT